MAIIRFLSNTATATAMGARAGIVVCITSFLLGQYCLSGLDLTAELYHPGALFTHWIADSLTLWKSPITDEHLWTAASYYSILTKGPPENLYILFAVLLCGATTMLWSFGDGQAENLMFDGGSICTQATCVVLSFKFRSILASLIWNDGSGVHLHCSSQYVLKR